MDVLERNRGQGGGFGAEGGGEPRKEGHMDVLRGFEWRNVS